MERPRPVREQQHPEPDLEWGQPSARAKPVASRISRGLAAKHDWMRSSRPQKSQANERFDSVQSLRKSPNSSTYRKQCTKTDCEDATFEGRESTCGNREKCLIFKHFVLVPAQAGRPAASDGAGHRSWSLQSTPKLVLDGRRPQL